MRGNASKYPDKKLSQEKAEMQLVAYLTNVRPILRDGITVATLLRKFNVPERVATYRLTVAQNRWAREAAE